VHVGLERFPRPRPALADDGLARQMVNAVRPHLCDEGARGLGVAQIRFEREQAGGREAASRQATLTAPDTHPLSKFAQKVFAEMAAGKAAAACDEDFERRAG